MTQGFLNAVIVPYKRDSCRTRWCRDHVFPWRGLTSARALCLSGTWAFPDSLTTNPVEMRASLWAGQHLPFLQEWVLICCAPWASDCSIRSSAAFSSLESSLVLPFLGGPALFWGPRNPPYASFICNLSWKFMSTLFCYQIWVRNAVLATLASLWEVT